MAPFRRIFVSDRYYPHYPMNVYCRQFLKRSNNTIEGQTCLVELPRLCNKLHSHPRTLRPPKNRMKMDNRMDGKLTVLPSFRFNFVALSFRNRLGLPWNPWPSSRHITSLQTIWMQKSTLCTVLWMIHWHSWCIFFSAGGCSRFRKQLAPSGTKWHGQRHAS